MPGGKVCGGISSISCKGLEVKSNGFTMPTETQQQEEKLLDGDLSLRWGQISCKGREVKSNGLTMPTESQHEEKLLDKDLSLRWGQRKRSRLAKGSAVESAHDPSMAKAVGRKEAGAQRESSPAAQWHPAFESTGLGSETCAPSKGETEPRHLPNRNAEDTTDSHNLSLQRKSIAETSAHIAVDLPDRQSPSHEKPHKVLDPSENFTDVPAAINNGLGHRRTEVESLHDRHVELGKLNLEFFIWPKIFISLSHKEKEDDFFAIKGSKLPQRPRRRAKHIEKTLLCVSPGTWLCEMTRDRYEVREKKSLRKKPRGLKAMDSLDSDSD